MALGGLQMATIIADGELQMADGRLHNADIELWPIADGGWLMAQG